MIVKKEILKSCGFKKKKVISTWVKRTVFSLLDVAIIEYDSFNETATVYIHEPKITRIVGSIKVNDVEDFLDFSWEFYVKYVAEYNREHNDWDEMAKAHGKATRKEIEERIIKEKERIKELVSNYRIRFEKEEKFELFAKDAYIIRKIIEGVSEEKFLEDCFDILSLSYSRGVYLNISKMGDCYRREFDIQVISRLKELGYSNEDIASMIISGTHSNEGFWNDGDSEEVIKEKIKSYAKGYARTPIIYCGFYYIKKDSEGNEKISSIGYDRFVECKHHIGYIGEEKYLRGYYYDITDWFIEKYEELKQDAEISRIYCMFCSHSVYENEEMWKAGVECGLFDKF